jgi:hypothetical protein
MIEAQFAKSLPKGMSAAQRARAIKLFDQRLTLAPNFKLRSVKIGAGRILRMAAHSGVIGNPGTNGGGFFNVHSGPAAASANSPHVIGTGWLSVFATPPSSQVANALKQALSAAGGQPRGSATYGTSSASQSSSSTITMNYASSAYGSANAPAIAAPAALQALLKASTPVHGSWGSGRLLQTTLLSVLITSKGQILAGAVTPALLYADVARDAG